MFKKGCIPYNKGIPMSDDAKKKASDKLKISMLGNKNGIHQRGKPKLSIRGEKHYNWVKDRDKLVKSESKHLDGKYREWMKSVKDRDGWKCKINNNDCNGRLEAHHILSWSKFPELRYEINNGISLCRFHHPLKKNDEIKLIPVFMNILGITSI